MHVFYHYKKGGLSRAPNWSAKREICSAYPTLPSTLRALKMLAFLFVGILIRAHLGARLTGQLTTLASTYECSQCSEHLVVLGTFERLTQNLRAQVYFEQVCEHLWVLGMQQAPSGARHFREVTQPASTGYFEQVCEHIHVLAMQQAPSGARHFQVRTRCTEHVSEYGHVLRKLIIMIF